MKSSNANHRMTRRGAFLVALVMLTSACGEDDIIDGSQQGAPAAEASPSASASAAADDGAPTALAAVEFTESDFVESEESRDPFRDYSYLFVKQKTTDRVQQRKVKAADFALDELDLAGIITRGRASVMLIDQTGFGWVAYVGDYIGKAELVSAGGTDGTEVAINWRVDRIRPTDVVFIREDSAHPDIPPTTRVMPLYPSGEGI